MRRAAERWEVRTTRVGRWTRPAATGRGGTGRFAAGRHGRRTRRRRECITRRPRRTIGQLCCSDSPDDGCSLSHHGGAETAKRPGRQAGLRYSAGRAPGGRGPVASLVSWWPSGPGSSAGAVARTRTRDGRPSGRRSRGKLTRCDQRSSKPRRRRGPTQIGREGNKTNNNRTTPVGAEICTRAYVIVEIALK